MPAPAKLMQPSGRYPVQHPRAAHNAQPVKKHRMMSRLQWRNHLSPGGISCTFGMMGCTIPGIKTTHGVYDPVRAQVGSAESTASFTGFLDNIIYTYL